MSVFSSTTKTSSILKSSTSLKSKLAEVINTPTKVRFVLPQSQKVKSILKGYVKKGARREYEQLVCMIRDSILYDDDISLLLKEAGECISLLNQDLRLFVQAILTIEWSDKNTAVVREYQSFIVNLISAHNYHAELVLDSLVSLFLAAGSDPEWENGSPTSSDTKKCQNVHQLLNVILIVAPMCKELFMHSLISKFPYMKKSAHIHEYYIQNLLWVLVYQPSLRPSILHLIFSKLTILDVHAPKEVLENYDEEVFNMDEDDALVAPSSFNVLGHTLDVCLNKVFSYLMMECLQNGEVEWTSTKSLYHDLIATFEAVILPTWNSHHVQFIMFVMCSVKPAVAEAFLNFLWKKVGNPNVATVIRQAAVFYMVSFLARATFVSLEILKGTLQQMADWIHSYIGTQDGLECVNSDVRVHQVFYTVCQSLFYLIAFRHTDLVKSKKNIVFVESLNLAKIVTSRLNPLRVCQPAVVQNFAAITRKYQLAYCYSIMEHNARNVLPTLYRDEKGATIMMSSILDSYYPFDPYVLPRSGAKIWPHYRDYSEVRLSTGNEVEMKDLSSEYDDFLEGEMSAGAGKSSQQFSYGTSPGFKFKT